MAKIVVFEGHDASGKATQSKLLHAALNDEDVRTMRVEVPTRACRKTYALIYKMLISGSAQKYPNMFQLVQFFNKLAFQLFVLPKLEPSADIIIFDRWALSMIIYGDATGVNRLFNRVLYWFLRRADVTFIMSGASFSRDRMNDSYEDDTCLQSQVKAAYVRWASSTNEHNVELVNNDKSIAEIHTRIMDALMFNGVI